MARRSSSPSASLVVLAALAVLASCAPDATTAEDDAEPSEEALSNLPLDLPDETDSADALVAPGYDHAQTELLDVRGVGDSAFAQTHQKDPMPAEIGAALDRFDPTGDKLRGDLTFMNWESVV